MGCEQGRDDEKPVHTVWVDSFAIGVYTVTNEEYLRFVLDTKREHPVSVRRRTIFPSSTAGCGCELV